MLSKCKKYELKLDRLAPEIEAMSRSARFDKAVLLATEAVSQGSFP